MPKPTIRIGLTMRVEKDSKTGETRDCLDQNWYSFMSFACPNHAWVPLPNIGKGIYEYLRRWEIEGVVLTGGNDIGECLIRDETELSIIKMAYQTDLPVVGICRGLQLLQHHAGALLSRTSPQIHVRQEHRLKVYPKYGFPELLPDTRVNSYHGFGVLRSQLAGDFSCLAESEDGFIEAITHNQRRITGLQWHPERNKHFSPLDRAIFNSTFSIGEWG